MKTNWDGDYYLGMTLEWNYDKTHNKRSVKLSMPGYVKEALIKFQHFTTKQQFLASPYSEPTYGKKTQYVTIDNITFTLEQAKILQKVCGKFLYYARAIDNTMLHALNDLATQVTKGTKKTEEALKWFLDYCATNPDAAIIYRASDMIIKCDSNAAYLVASEARSRVAGFIYMGNKYSTNNQIINAPIMVIARVLKMVVASAAEAEIAALFHNAQEIVPLRITAEEMGHPQPTTEIKTDNTTAKGIADNTLKQQKSTYH